VAVEHIASARVLSSNPASGTFTFPGGYAVRAHDVAVVALCSFDPTWDATLSGAAQLYEVHTAGVCALIVGWQRFTGAEANAGTFTRSTSVTNSTTIEITSIFRGVDTIADPWEAGPAASQISNSAAPDPGGVTGITAGSMVITILAANQETTVPTSNVEALTPPSTYNLAIAGSSTTGSDASGALAYKTAAGTSDDPGVWGTHWAATIDYQYWTGALKAWPTAQGTPNAITTGIAPHISPASDGGRG
jgi:hypothetical protein